MSKRETCGKQKYVYLCDGCIHDPYAVDKYEPITNADRRTVCRLAADALESKTRRSAEPETNPGRFSHSDSIGNDLRATIQGRDRIKGYEGIGPNAGKFIPADEGFEYVCAQVGITAFDYNAPEAAEFRASTVEWYFSGNWIEVSENE